MIRPMRSLSPLILAAGLLVASLGLGILGYAYFESLPMLDGFLNAANISVAVMS